MFFLTLVTFTIVHNLKLKCALPAQFLKTQYSLNYEIKILLRCALFVCVCVLLVWMNYGHDRGPHMKPLNQQLTYKHVTLQSDTLHYSSGMGEGSSSGVYGNTWTQSLLSDQDPKTVTGQSRKKLASQQSVLRIIYKFSVTLKK